MAINFPTSLDVFTDPTASDQLNLPSHSGQHTDLNNAVEALEAKVGINSSAVTSSHDYKIAQLEALGTWTAFTPSWNNFTPGNATEDWSYMIINDVMIITGRTVLGSTSSMGSSPSMTLPDSKTADRWSTGFLVIRNFGTATHTGAVYISGPADTDISMLHQVVSGSNVVTSAISSTAPFTWTNPDYFTFTIILDITP